MALRNGFNTAAGEVRNPFQQREAMHFHRVLHFEGVRFVIPGAATVIC